jgi:hypothetical protein
MLLKENRCALEAAEMWKMKFRELEKKEQPITSEGEV